MATKMNMELDTSEIKSIFYTWLLNKKFKQHNCNSIIASLDTASEQLLRRKITNIPLWGITRPGIFADVYKKALNDKMFRVTDRPTYFAFIKTGKLYLKFLKTKPNFSRETVELPNNKANRRITIKDAVICVLKAETRGMTAEEIYSKIIKHNLYTFGAQNPINVVRNTIEYACENSGYSNRNAVPCFRFDRNSEGKRIYSLLTMNVPMDAAGQQNASENVPSNIDHIRTKELSIWNDRIKENFQSWLKQEQYSQKTVDNYRRVISQVFRSYEALAQQAVSSSCNALEATQKYLSLLNNNSEFLGANNSRHNQFTAALAALERFYSSSGGFIDGEDGEPVSKQPKMMGIHTFPLDDIVDLDEGKAGIREILEAHFQTLYGYSNISILWNAAQDTLSIFLNDNAINNADDLWRFLQRAFYGEYVLSNPHIWKSKPNYPQSYVGVIINLARQLGGIVTREQIDEYFDRIKQSSPINSTIIRQGLLMFYANKHFILSEVVDLTDERCAVITKSLDRLFEREKVSYIVLRDITAEWFSSLPTIKGGIKWTALLLQEVLRLRPTIGYKVIFSGLDGQALDTLGVAMVPSKSDINSFADVVHCYCYERDLLGKRMVTEDFRIILRDAGMLEGNELIYNLHKALRDYRFAFTDENKMVKILER